MLTGVAGLFIVGAGFIRLLSRHGVVNRLAIGTVALFGLATFVTQATLLHNPVTFRTAFTIAAVLCGTAYAISAFRGTPPSPK
jgi:hypothetical protein